MHKRAECLRMLMTFALLGALSTPAAAFVIPVPEPNVLLLLAGGVAVALVVGKLRGRK